MAEKIEIGGRSKYEVALGIADRILTAEKKAAGGGVPTRQEYLKAIAASIRALEGQDP